MVDFYIKKLGETSVWRDRLSNYNDTNGVTVALGSRSSLLHALDTEAGLRYSVSIFAYIIGMIIHNIRKPKENQLSLQTLTQRIVHTIGRLTGVSSLQNSATTIRAYQDMMPYVQEGSDNLGYLFKVLNQYYQEPSRRSRIIDPNNFLNIRVYGSTDDVFDTIAALVSNIVTCERYILRYGQADVSTSAERDTTRLFVFYNSDTADAASDTVSTIDIMDYSCRYIIDNSGSKRPVAFRLFDPYGSTLRIIPMFDGAETDTRARVFIETFRNFLS